MKKSDEQNRKEGGSPTQVYPSVVDLMLKTGVFKEEKGKGVCKLSLEDLLEDAGAPEPKK